MAKRSYRGWRGERAFEEKETERGGEKVKRW